MKKSELIMTTSEQIDIRTRTEYLTGPVTHGWLATQFWTFPGGDAVVVLVRTEIWVVLRLEDEVFVLKAESILRALAIANVEVE